MKAHVAVSLLGLVLLSLGCSVAVSKETRYLQSAKDHATQEEVQQQLGAPTLTVSNDKGEVIWVYQVRGQQAGNRMTAPGIWCDEYVLTFDEQTTLRQWTHRSEFHGGELMPTYCVTGGFDSKS